jgi:hypothetical protein
MNDSREGHEFGTDPQSEVHNGPDRHPNERLTQ